MRKITELAVNAFYYQENFKKSNTEVEYNGAGLSKLYLHGNLVAELLQTSEAEELRITTAGRNTNVTKERLRGILEMHFGSSYLLTTKKGKLYLNDIEWNGNWITL